VQQLMEVAKDTRPGGPAQGAHIHVVHLSDAEDSLSLIKVQVTLIDLLSFEHGLPLKLLWPYPLGSNFLLK